MSLIAISYDLSQPNRDYKALIDAIKAYGKWCHMQESFWLVRTDSPIADIRDYLAKFIDKDDSLFVGEMTGVTAWRKLSKPKSDWLLGVSV